MLRQQHVCQGALGQKFQFFVKNGPFLLQNVFISDFLARIRNQRLRIDPSAKFQLHWTKDKGTRILTWNNTKNGLMTSYLPSGDDVSNFLWLLRDFVPEYHHAKFGCNWTTNKGETEGGTMYPLPQPIWFQKTPAWIRLRGTYENRPKLRENCRSPPPPKEFCTRKVKKAFKMTKNHNFQRKFCDFWQFWRKISKWIKSNRTTENPFFTKGYLIQFV